MSNSSVSTFLKLYSRQDINDPSIYSTPFDYSSHNFDYSSLNFVYILPKSLIEILQSSALHPSMLPDLTELACEDVTEGYKNELNKSIKNPRFFPLCFRLKPGLQPSELCLITGDAFRKLRGGMRRLRDVRRVAYLSNGAVKVEYELLKIRVFFEQNSAVQTATGSPSPPLLHDFHLSRFMTVRDVRACLAEFVGPEKEARFCFSGTVLPENQRVFDLDLRQNDTLICQLKPKGDLWQTEAVAFAVGSYKGTQSPNFGGTLLQNHGPQTVLGLLNIGNSCYMNSAIQAIASNRELRELVMGVEVYKEVVSQNKLGSMGRISAGLKDLLGMIRREKPRKTGIFHRSFGWNADEGGAVQQHKAKETESDSALFEGGEGGTASETAEGDPDHCLIESGHSQEIGPVSAWRFKEIFQKRFPVFEGFGQHDSSEFLGLLLDSLHEDFNRAMVAIQGDTEISAEGATEKKAGERTLLPEKDCAPGDGLPAFALPEESTLPQTEPKNADSLQPGRSAWVEFLSKNFSWFSERFYGQLESRTVCPCGTERKGFEVFQTLALGVPVLVETEILVSVPKGKVKLKAKSRKGFKDVLGSKAAKEVAKVLGVEGKELQLKGISGESLQSLDKVFALGKEEKKIGLKLVGFKGDKDPEIEDIDLEGFTEEYHIDENECKERNDVDKKTLQGIQASEKTTSDRKQKEVLQTESNLIGEAIVSGDTNELTLSDLLSSFSLTERLESGNELFCENCQTLRSATRTLKLHRAPKYFHILLKRNKTNDPPIRFPLEGLDLSNLVSYSSTPSDYGVSPLEALGPSRLSAIKKNHLTPSWPSTLADPPPIYRLYAVINHYGSRLSGHYTAFCRSQEGWILCDDSKVRPASPYEVVSNHAYLLLYERVEST